MKTNKPFQAIVTTEPTVEPNLLARAIQKRANAVGISITELCQTAGVSRRWFEFLKQRTPQTIMAYFKIDERLRELEQSKHDFSNIGLSDMMQVVLTQRGADILNMMYNFSKQLNSAIEWKTDYKDGDTFKAQLWELFTYFGNHVHWGADIPFSNMKITN